MIAVIRTGGKQYAVAEGDTLRVERIASAEEGKKITFDDILLVAKKDGSSVSVGTPTVQGASVSASVLKQGRARKLIVRKFKAKTRYTRTQGHRQPYTEVKIEKISAK